MADTTSLTSCVLSLVQPQKAMPQTDMYLSKNDMPLP